MDSRRAAAVCHIVSAISNIIHGACCLLASRAKQGDQEAISTAETRVFQLIMRLQV